jgi:hypothetical protein
VAAKATRPTTSIKLRRPKDSSLSFTPHSRGRTCRWATVRALGLPSRHRLRRRGRRRVRVPFPLASGVPYRSLVRGCALFRWDELKRSVGIQLMGQGNLAIKAKCAWPSHPDRIRRDSRPTRSRHHARHRLHWRGRRLSSVLCGVE